MNALDFRTFAEISEPGELQQKCLELCQELAGDMEHDAITVSEKNYCFQLCIFYLRYIPTD